LLQPRPFTKAGQIRASPDYSAITSALSASIPLDAWVDAEARLPLLPLTQRVEGGLRQMRAAYRSAPDYAAISGAVAAAGCALAYSDLLENAKSAAVERAEDGLRRMRAAYRSAPDYAAISGAVAAAGCAIAYGQALDAPSAIDAAPAVEMAAKAAAKTLVQWPDAKAATPQYTAMLSAAALFGSTMDVDEIIN